MPTLIEDVELVSDWKKGGDPSLLMRQEWLITNGLGGYASTTVMGNSTRKYHGLFLPNLPDPFGRTVIIPRLDILIKVNGKTISLGGAESPVGKISSHSHDYLKEFKLRWKIPHWTYEIENHELEVRAVMPHG